jgi:hypothetical protein
MLFSVVDHRSGVAYQEYRCVYGEDVESALRFLFHAMAEKSDLPFQGIPQMIYMDNGPIAKSLRPCARQFASRISAPEDRRGTLRDNASHI